MKQDDLISRQAALKAIQDMADLRAASVNHNYLMGFQDAAEAIEQMAAAGAPAAGAPVSLCDLCRFNPPSAFDGKPCSECPAEQNGVQEEEGGSCHG